MARERKTAGVMSCFEIRDARSPGPVWGEQWLDQECSVPWVWVMSRFG